MKRIIKLWNKAKQAGISMPNIISWLSLKWLEYFGVVWGTLRLKVKSAILGVELGRDVRAHGSVGLLRWPGGKIIIGDHARIISSWRRASSCSLSFPARLRVFGPGARIEIGPGCELSGTSITARSRTIRLGRQVLVAPNCIMVDSDFHALEPVEQRAILPGFDRDADVTIEDYAWIGMNCIILKGSHIGKGAIIGAGSVVCGNIPSHTVAAGAPARVIRTLAGKNNGV